MKRCIDIVRRNSGTTSNECILKVENRDEEDTVQDLSTKLTLSNLNITEHDCSDINAVLNRISIGSQNSSSFNLVSSSLKTLEPSLSNIPSLKFLAKITSKVDKGGDNQDNNFGEEVLPTSERLKVRRASTILLQTEEMLLFPTDMLPARLITGDHLNSKMREEILRRLDSQQARGISAPEMLTIYNSFIKNDSEFSESVTNHDFLFSFYHFLDDLTKSKNIKRVPSYSHWRYVSMEFASSWGNWFTWTSIDGKCNKNTTREQGLPIRYALC